VGTTLPKPAFDRISTLTSLILITYGLVRLMTLPSVEADVALFGLLINLEFKPQTVMLVLAAALAAAGSEWLIKGHTKPVRSNLVIEHWVIPSFAAIAIGVVVIRIPSSPQLWLALVVGAFLLVAVLTAEFIVAYKDDPRYANVALALRGLAFLLLTGSYFAISESQLRAIFAVPLVMIISIVVSWRLFHLAFPNVPKWTWAALLGMLTGQIAIGLHYLPLSPLSTSLLLGIITYQGYQLILAHVTRGIDKSRIIESIGLSIFAFIAVAYTA